MNKQHLHSSIITGMLIAVLMVIVQVVPARSLLLSERLMTNGGWIQNPANMMHTFSHHIGSCNIPVVAQRL